MENGRHHLEPDRTAHYGPWRRAELTAIVATSKALRASRDGIVAWWSIRGRRGLLVAAFGAIFGLGGLILASSDHGLVHTLNSRGIRTPAVISDVSHGRSQSSLDAVDVRFTVRGRPTTHELSNINNVPNTLTKGQQVTVVYDPRDSSRVLLDSQLHSGLVSMDYGVAAAGGAIAIGGTSWWLLRRRRTIQRHLSEND